MNIIKEEEEEDLKQKIEGFFQNIITNRKQKKIGTKYTTNGTEQSDE